MSDDDGRDDARKIVLARRARFIAATVASFGMACSDPKHPPMPCLEPLADPGAGVDAGSPEPQVCLSVAAPDPPEPQPCLSPMPPPDAGAPIATDPTPPATATPKKPLPPKKPPGGDPMPCLSVAPKQPPRKK